MRILFLILIVMSSVAFAQTEENTEPQETPKAIKFDEFEKATNGYDQNENGCVFCRIEQQSGGARLYHQLRS